jgi:DNA-binding transcriptional ArsR family regulator
MLDHLMPRSRVAVLTFLLVESSDPCHLREIARRSPVVLRAAQRELAILEEVGLVKRQPRGRQVFYEVEYAHPLYAPLRALLLAAQEEGGAPQTAASRTSAARGAARAEPEVEEAARGADDSWRVW